MRRSMSCTLFLSTLSLRRATCPALVSVPGVNTISIHALLAESDSCRHAERYGIRYFYPRSPCGERRAREPTLRYSSTFLSTLSLRRATGLAYLMVARVTFLSTLSLRRATLDAGDLLGVRQHFYPRSPCGERRYGLWTPTSDATIFLSTLSLRRATWPPLPR